LEKAHLTTRTQLKSWLCASSALAAFVCSPSAFAAHSELTAAALSRSTPKAEPALVKSTQEENPRGLPPLSLPSLASLASLAPPRPELQPEPKPLPESKSIRNEILWHGLRIPTIIAFGLSGLSAGGAVATGFAASRGNDPRTCDASCSEHDVRQRALLLTTGVLTGMAAAGLGIGITFMVKAPSNRTEPAIRPRFDATISGQRAIAKVGWVFSSF
jgi:hypothetical protein